MISWMAALSVGSIVQNIVLYLFLVFLFYANYCLLEAGSDKKRYAPENKAPGKVSRSILAGFSLYRRISRLAREVRKSRENSLRTEKALGAKTDELESLLEHMTDAYYTVDSNWNFTYINKAYERIQRRDRAQLLGKNIWELFPYGKERRYFKEYDYALREQVSVHFEEFNSFNGMWVSANAYPVNNGLAICFRDITQEKLRREKC